MPPLVPPLPAFSPLDSATPQAFPFPLVLRIHPTLSDTRETVVLCDKWFLFR